MIAFHAASTVPPSGTSTSSRSCPVASRYRAKRRTRTRTCCWLEAVGLTAAAGRLDVRVLDGKPGAHHVVLHEVDLAPAQVRCTVLVDVDLDALGRFDTFVGGVLLVFPAELIRHPGAAPPDNADTQPPLGLALLEPQLGDFLGCRVGHRDHSILP